MTTATLIGPDGNAVDLGTAEREFAASLAAPSADEPLAPPPPRRDPEADAKFGNKADGTPRKRKPGPGRPPKTAAAAESKETPEAAEERRREGVTGLVQIGA